MFTSCLPCTVSPMSVFDAPGTKKEKLALLLSPRTESKNTLEFWPLEPLFNIT